MHDVPHLNLSLEGGMFIWKGFLPLETVAPARRMAPRVLDSSTMLPRQHRDGRDATRFARGCLQSGREGQPYSVQPPRSLNRCHRLRFNTDAQA